MSEDKRLDEINTWLSGILNGEHYRLEPASNDASFRRYFRVKTGQQNFIVMDAPPAQEDVRPFIKVGQLFAEVGVNVPSVIRHNCASGFLLLSDLGVISYLERLGGEGTDRLYRDALEALFILQTAIDPVDSDLPIYDEDLLRREMGLFQEWFLEKLLGIDVSSTAQSLLNQMQKELIISALEQPAVCVHRDYHSRNLMVTGTGNPGVLDFQDAVIGPITYDLVSLLRDCYISWPDSQVEKWLHSYYQRLVDAEKVEVGFEQFFQWFDLMGVQRHLKAIGIFSRLKLRDGKEGYLADIPRTLDYIRAVCRRRNNLSDLGLLIEEEVMPALDRLVS